MHDHRCRPSARARSGPRSSPLAARSRDVRRRLAAGLRPAGGADPGPSHHAHLRQHAPDGRAGDPRAVGSPGRAARQRAPRQPRQGAAAGRRAASEGRRPEGAGRDRLAGARHRHRRGRPGLPARLAAQGRELPATGRAFRTRRRWHTEGTPLPAVAGRSRGVRGVARCRRPRRARPPDDPRAAARRARAADHGRSGRARMARGRAVCARAPRLALSRPCPRRFRRRGWHAGARLQHTARPARRVDPPRRGQPRAARPARRAAVRAHQRRHDPGQRRLPGGPRARRPVRRHRQRGLRGREPARRRLPARQQLVSDHARGARHGPGRGRARHAADHPVLAGRGAGPQRRAVARGIAPARGDRRTPGHRPSRRQRPALAHGGGRARRGRRRSAGRLSGRGARGARLPADGGHARARALLRRGGRHAAGDPLAVRQPPQPRLGAGAAQALLPQVQFRAAGGRDRGQHRPLAHHGAQLRPCRGHALPAFGDRAAAPDPGAARCADVHHALALGRRRCARAAAFPRRQEGGAAARGWRPRI